MNYCKREINLGPTFAKLNNQYIQKLQENVDRYVVLCEDMFENMNKKFMLRFHRATQKQLYIMMCAYERDPSHLFKFASQTCAFNILTNLINEKYYSQSQSPVEFDQVDH